MSAPTNPKVGQKWYDTSVKPSGQWKIWTGTVWNANTKWVQVGGRGKELIGL